MTPATRELLAVTDVTAAPASAASAHAAAIPAEACVPNPGDAPLSAGAATQVAYLLKAVAEPLRLRMLSYLAQGDGGEACVCDLAALADVSQPTVSHHLKVLREAGIVTAERRGTWVWYAIVPAYAAPIDVLLDGFAASLPSTQKQTRRHP